MAKNRLVINHIEDSIELLWQRGQAMFRKAPAVSFEHPFDEKILGELRWYLEEYLRFPYGIEPEKAAKIEQKFQVWGQQLFELVFRSSEKAREFFQEATRERLEYCEIGINSDDPSVLNLPWELLYSPDYQFLAPSLAGMYRSLNHFTVRAELEALPQDKLNILLVIARPYGERDISLKTIARPVLEALKPIRQQVNLKVLRPPSFEQFERELNAHKGFYHIVHFDGHGDFDPNSQGFQHSFGSAGQGVLVFEHLDGSPQVITAAQIAQNLRDCDVPIFILNACKSAQEGSGSFSSVATQLVSLGAKGVVAMAYSVYADAAKHFMGRLYEQLIQGASLDRAVADGRKEVLNHPLRSSPKGKLRLADWMVPVLYQQETYAPFMPADSDTIPDLDQFLDQPTTTDLVELPEEGSYGFVGRDYEILRLERAFCQNKIVLLQGMGGVGKTELACGFARWLNETQGRSQSFFLSFEHGAGLSHVINQVGRLVWQDKFSQYSFEQQQTAVLKYLKTQPCLLIWDNFEPVAGFPTGNEPLLLDDEREELKRFLKNLRDGASWVLITSRREERWLDCGYTLVHLQGLSQPDAEEFAAQILQRVGVDRTKLPPEYLDLLKLLGGHPLSLRVVLPHLKTQNPTQLIEALRQGFDTFQGTEEEGKDKSLIVSLDYAFTKLSKRSQRHLPFLAFFSGLVDARWLPTFSGTDEPTQIYREVFDENFHLQDWLELLAEVSEAGILEKMDQSLYSIHPTLPWYLNQKITRDYLEKPVSRLEENLVVFYAILADALRQNLVQDPDNSTTWLLVEEPNLLNTLKLAERHQAWNEIQAIVQSLIEIYERLDRKFELIALLEKILIRLNIKIKESDTTEIQLFQFRAYLQGVKANQIFHKGDIKAAKIIYEETLTELTNLKEGSLIKSVASFNLNLGCVYQEQRDFDRALAYYQDGLQIFERENDLHSVANIYHQLGWLAYEQKSFDISIIYYTRARQIFEYLGDSYHMAREYHHLGMIAEIKEDFEKAKIYFEESIRIYEGLEVPLAAAYVYLEMGNLSCLTKKTGEAKSYYMQSLQIYEDGGYYEKAAGVYHNLGKLSEWEDDFDMAEDYYIKSLNIFEHFESNYHIAREFYHLGMLAQKKREFYNSVLYYEKAIDFSWNSKDYHRISKTFNKLGELLEQRGDWEEVLKLYIYALIVDFEHNEGQVGLTINSLGRAFQILGEVRFKAIWQQIIGRECADEIYSAIHEASEDEERFNVSINQLGQLLNSLGQEVFDEMWCGATGERCPIELFLLIQAASEN